MEVGCKYGRETLLLRLLMCVRWLEVIQISRINLSSEIQGEVQVGNKVGLVYLGNCWINGRSEI